MLEAYELMVKKELSLVKQYAEEFLMHVDILEKATLVIDYEDTLRDNLKYARALSLHNNEIEREDY